MTFQLARDILMSHLFFDARSISSYDFSPLCAEFSHKLSPEAQKSHVHFLPFLEAF
jgi:hypothetical protein